jgi:hypothetical protein
MLLTNVVFDVFIEKFRRSTSNINNKSGSSEMYSEVLADKVKY